MKRVSPKMENLFLEGFCNKTLNKNLPLPRSFKNEYDYVKYLFKKRYNTDNFKEEDYCKPFLLKTKIEPQCVEKKICVIDFVQDGGGYNYTNRNCGSTTHVDYKIIYYQIFDTNTMAGPLYNVIETTIKDVCTETIIHVYLRPDDALLFDYLKYFILNVKKFNKATLFLVIPPPQASSTLSDLPFKLSNQFLIDNAFLYRNYKQTGC